LDIKTLGFASYWKEVAVVLAALFAIAGTVFEVRDKTSQRITVYGRIFFGLTFLSMIGGFYAQWEENAREVNRNKETQTDMLKLIENTNLNVYDLTRILQPLVKANIYLSFKATLARAERETSIDHVASFSIPDVDWTKWPDNRVSDLIILQLLNVIAWRKHI
jgi:cytochrome c biogenesis protein CcdA